MDIESSHSFENNGDQLPLTELVVSEERESSENTELGGGRGLNYA